MDKNLNRRNFLRLMGGSIAAMMLPSSAGWGSTSKKPNFILIFADDLGYGDIGGFGLKKSPFETPNREPN
jgi:arylsulfatase A-like enzyme